MTAPVEPVGGLLEARALAVELKRRWRKGEAPDAAAALAAHPELGRYKSIVVDLAYEEFILREQAGDAPQLGPFADQFASFRASVRNMLDAHKLLQDRPELLEAKEEWPEVGTMYEGLELLAVLGRGTFGRAYLARDHNLKRFCALKVSTGGTSEAQVIGQLAHPHITDVHWARTIGMRTAVCMPFVGISTLADVIAGSFPPNSEAPPPSARLILEAAEADGLAGKADRRSVVIVWPDEPYLVGACAIGARIADAVCYIHTQQITHGDLKPSNVVIGPGGAPHIIDFNLSMVEGPPGVVRGTPAYMAPELLDALSFRPDAPSNPVKADLFALGVMVFEFLAGYHPFPLERPGAWAELADTIRRGPPPLPDWVPNDVAQVIASYLAADRVDRPETATELMSVLDRVVGLHRNPDPPTLLPSHDLPAPPILPDSFGLLSPVTLPTPVELGPVDVTASRPSLLPDPPGPVLDRRRWLILILAMVVVLAFPVTFLVSGGHQPALEPEPQPEHPPALQPLPALPVLGEQELFARGLERLHAGRWAEAREDFLKVRGDTQKPCYYGFAAYAAARDGDNRLAWALGLRETKSGGASAEVFNNLGYTSIQSGNRHEAIEPLNKALALEPKLQAALFNRAIARFPIAGAIDPASYRQCVADIEAALQGYEQSAELHRWAALIYASGCEIEPDFKDMALGQLQAAIRIRALWPSSLAHPAFEPIQDHPRFPTKALNGLPEDPTKTRLLEPRLH